MSTPDFESIQLSTPVTVKVNTDSDGSQIVNIIVEKLIPQLQNPDDLATHLPSIIGNLMQEAARLKKLSKPQKKQWVLHRVNEITELVGEKFQHSDDSIHQRIGSALTMVPNLIDLFKNIEKGKVDVGEIFEIGEQAATICCPAFMKKKRTDRQIYKQKMKKFSKRKSNLLIEM